MIEGRDVEQEIYVGDHPESYFRYFEDRRLNTLCDTYLLPADDEEIRRLALHHRLVQFLFRGRNYVGPVREVLQFGQKRRSLRPLSMLHGSPLLADPTKVLDLGTGDGTWAIAMADEFPRAEVIGIDVAPIQPTEVPQDCSFELWDLSDGIVPYFSEHFDLVHARSLNCGIKDYPRLVEDVGRVLRPGGLAIFIEPDLIPHACPGEPGMPELIPHPWQAFWETFRWALSVKGVDPNVPHSLKRIVEEDGQFENIVSRAVNIPVGFWPTEQSHLTMGQLQWMDYEALLPASKPLLKDVGLGEERASRLIAEAQEVLYQPTSQNVGLRLYTRIYVVYATKRVTI